MAAWRSASGTVARPGFDSLVAWLCDRKVAAVLCFDASMVASNGQTGTTYSNYAGLSKRAY